MGHKRKLLKEKETFPQKVADKNSNEPQSKTLLTLSSLQDHHDHHQHGHGKTHTHSKSIKHPQTAIAQELLSFLESTLGKGTVFAIEIFTEHKNWKSRGHGRVQFDSPEAKIKALSLSEQRKLLFKGFYLSISPSFEDAIIRPVEPRNRVGHGGGVVLLAGVMVRADCMGSWNLGMGIMSHITALQFHLGELVLPHNSQGLLKHAPKVYRKISGTKVASKFATDRYHICKEDFDFLWVRTTDFSKLKSIGYLSSLCWEIEEGLSSSDIYSSLPYYSKDVMELALEGGVKFNHSSDLVPIVTNYSDFRLPYEVLFQLTSLVHTQKVSLAAVDTDLFQILGRLDLGTALLILNKMHKLHSTCYDPKSFIKNQSSITGQSGKSLTVMASKRLTDQNVMSCHRVLVTPSKIYCLGPELETSNYIVKNFASYASDFLRPYRTDIYRRILSVLRDGIVIGDKNFQFLAFSASQLRSNAVWMFASNDHVKAEDIREWMGCFNKIRSISKCAARMGQLFSSSMQTLEVHPRDYDLIPDIEVTTDGVKYCFSDGIGKISYAFAKDIARKLGLPHIPSAFQIRYGGYKG
ncbi:UNVERIFIED_CONTAM: RNA-dependent RNA polymerase 2 [Sesamum calycinum]|uniref:RNA-dependent RNA polymerase n=1 Tax=Sesamum calycinum TaxID=2727403 RepID=A0AAW2NG97_9LAMI